MLRESEMKLYTKQVTNMLRSLYSAVNEAGGCALNWDLDKMTVNELISILATNNILFVYTIPNKRPEEFKEEDLVDHFYGRRLAGRQA